MAEGRKISALATASPFIRSAKRAMTRPNTVLNAVPTMTHSTVLVIAVRSSLLRKISVKLSKPMNFCAGESSKNALIVVLITGMTNPTASRTSAGPRNSERCAHSRHRQWQLRGDGVQPAEHQTRDGQPDASRRAAR